jgi:hypothetical protein
MFSAKSKPSFPLALPAEDGPPSRPAEVGPRPPPRARAAPKLIRRKGVWGTLLELGALGDEAGSSSKGDSSTEPELAEETDSARLRMLPNGDDCAPGRVLRPRVVIERRRGPWPCCDIEDRVLNMSTKEDRRRVGLGGVGSRLFRSEDIVDGLN